jgi:GTP-binding protein Era
MQKAGFVNIIGNPNAGKSTLMNSLLGEKLSIVSPKAQTTRHRTFGILNEDNCQIVFSDTPGIVNPSYKLHNEMLQMVNTSFEDADIILLITDINEEGLKNNEIFEKLKQLEVPIIVVVNKIDLSTQEEATKKIQQWQEIFPKADIIATSALRKFNLQTVLEKIKEHLPEGTPFFPEDQLTDKPERFFAAEIIREKIFFRYQQEIPYCTEVQIDSFKESDDIIRIHAIIFVERKSQKAIIIGQNGKMIKHLGIDARIEMEKFFKKKIYLDLFVKVDENWRNSDNALKKYGYKN